MKMSLPVLAAGLAMPCLSLGANAQEAMPSQWVPFAEARINHEFEADIDSGGAFDVTRAQVQGGLNYASSRRDSIGFGLRYDYNSYGFDNVPAIGALHPWDDVEEFAFAVPYRWGPTENWDVLVVASVASNVEEGADFDDGVTGTLIAGASYKVSGDLKLGAGLGVSSEIEDDVSFFPLLMIDWQMTQSLTLSTRGASRVVDGPQATLRWQADDAWALALGAGYESFRFRLDDSGAAPGGVGQEEAFPVFASVTYGNPRAFEVFAFGGYKLGGELTLENASGTTVYASDYDEAPFVGAGLRYNW
ncbi:MAG: hypothetical protein P8Q36_06235 [Alphaproteobacteria bacterium]|nr:hypothetical protein [Rhodospirillaceae bacterium]MDG2480456.1 hypothetical protein [Alphaproteobacteria bacterium]MBT6205989.1 hypothetical protein [Rhodospirillaceae bacterium]MBT6512077.1 hypothetical protein [Rhodospirillaceae bacterium]MBT7615428.1 hypothetical protein [Rhodospirillaceae bacterium]